MAGSVTLHNDKSIAELIALASSDDLASSGAACRQLLRRHDECRQHASQVIGLLQHGNFAIEDMAFRTVERIGEPASPALLNAMNGATGRFRSYLISLLPIVADFNTWFPILTAEFNGPDEAMRFHAANCIGRCYNPGTSWPDDAIATLDRCIEVLRTCRHSPATNQYWFQARMTLRHLGLLDSNTT